jgi:GNAT superfamily N-acetyltransferase
VDVEVRSCTQADIDRFRASPIPPAVLRHHEERWGWQEAGLATYLLALHDGDLVGRATILRHSKYELVRNRLGQTPEVNALESSIPSRGIGTKIMACAESEAGSWGASLIGLGVSPENTRARRLYAHLGYLDWGQGTICDEWIERDDTGSVVADRVDECLYLTKRLRAERSGECI